MAVGKDKVVNILYFDSRLLFGNKQQVKNTVKKMTDVFDFKKRKKGKCTGKKMVTLYEG